MIILGFVVFAIAVAAAIVAIAQNGSATVQVHGLGYSGQVHVYWVLVAGLIVAAVGLLGLAMMRSGVAHAARKRTERRGLVRENARLNEIAAERPVAVAPTTAYDPAAAYDPGTAPVLEGDGSTYTPVDDAEVAAGKHTRHRPLLHRTSHV